MEKSNASGHSFKMRLGKFKGNAQGRFVAQRVVSALNTPLGVRVEVDMLVAFERFL